jgi:hypothetical protein
MDKIIEQLQAIKNKHEQDDSLFQEMSIKYNEILKSNELLKKHIDVQFNEINGLKKYINELEDDQKEFTKVSNIIKIDKENSLLKNEVRLLKQQLLKCRAPLTPQPIEIQQQPIEIQQQPIEIQQQPIEIQQQPIEIQQQPVEIQQQPIEIQQQPIEIQQQPIEIQQQPIEIQQQPIEIQEQPIEIQQQPIEIQQQPIEAEAEMEVYEKCIKGKIYYICDDIIYTKNNDESIGPKIGSLSKINGKTKVSWLK